MSVFTDLAQALGPFVGGTDIAGLILGTISVAFLALVFGIATSRAGHGAPMGSLILGVIVGSGFSYAVGWYPVWMPIVLTIGCGAVIVYGSGLGLSQGSD